MRTLSALLAIQTSTYANVFIYYLRKLPFLGKLLPAALYSHREWKQTMAILARVFITLWGFLSRMAYVGLLLYFPVVHFGETLSEAERLQQFVHLFFLISFVVAGVSSAAILEPKRSKYIAVKLMRMSPAHYMRTTLTFKYVTYFIYILPALLLFGTQLGASVGFVLLLAGSATLWKVGCEYLHLKLFEAKGIVLIKKTGIVWIIMLLGYVGAYLPILTGSIPFTGGVLLYWPVHLIGIGFGLYAARHLARYPDYRTVTDAATRRDDPLLDLGRVMREANQYSVQSKESDYTLHGANDERLQAMQGYRYLNALFFTRHRSLVSQPVRRRLMIIGAFGVVATFITLWADQAAQYVLNDFHQVFRILFLTMIYFSVGENMCKAMFRHCDMSMMRYSFYRKAAGEHFRIRLIRIAGLNALIALAVCAAFTLPYAAAGGSVWQLEVGMLWGSVLALSLFFTIHHLFVYYILQPYATELNIKSPFYFVFTYILSGTGGVSLVIPIPPVVYAAIALCVTAVYLGTAFVLVHRYGSRTFRMK